MFIRFVLILMLTLFSISNSLAEVKDSYTIDEIYNNISACESKQAEFDEALKVFNIKPSKTAILKLHSLASEIITRSRKFLTMRPWHRSHIFPQNTVSPWPGGAGCSA